MILSITMSGRGHLIEYIFELRTRSLLCDRTICRDDLFGHATLWEDIKLEAVDGNAEGAARIWNVDHTGQSGLDPVLSVVRRTHSSARINVEQETTLTVQPRGRGRPVHPCSQTF